ncbi:MAG: sensor histidine kinase KdpD [Clostridium sp.]|uniref:sensor histidine kinase KdpD n=1 Tax=Clostridium sp. TaxID=1506 RepID=UPI002FC5F1B4
MDKQTPHLGKLKIYIGFAPGVGKTYAMLNEANDILESGEDIVIGFLETQNRRETNKQIGNLKTIDRLKIKHGDIVVEEMNLPLIREMKPTTVIIDNLAHANSEECVNEKRYEDVLDLLKNGINVITTLNIQNIESLNTLIKDITGVKVIETVPDTLLTDAELVLVDLSPKQLQERLNKGILYSDEKIIRNFKHFYREGNLCALREIALRQIAEEVDEDMHEYKMQHGIHQLWHATDRVMICITSNPSCEKLIRRGARIARRYKCEWFVVHAQHSGLFSKKMSPESEKVLNNHFKLSEKLGAKTISLSSNNIYRSLSEFASNKHITQIVIGHNLDHHGDKLYTSKNLTKFLKNATKFEVHIVPVD